MSQRRDQLALLRLQLLQIQPPALVCMEPGRFRRAEGARALDMPGQLLQQGIGSQLDRLSSGCNCCPSAGIRRTLQLAQGQIEGLQHIHQCPHRHPGHPRRCRGGSRTDAELPPPPADARADVLKALLAAALGTWCRGW